MDAAAIAILIPAVTGAIGTIIGGVISLRKWAKAEAKKEYLQERAEKTILTLEAANADLVTENQRLWALVQESSP